MDKEKLQLIKLLADKVKLDKFIAEDEKIKQYLIAIAKNTKDLMGRMEKIEVVTPKMYAKSNDTIASLEDRLKGLSDSINTNVSKLSSSSMKSSLDFKNLDGETKKMINEFSKSVEKLQNELSIVHSVVDNYSSLVMPKDGDNGRGIDRVEVAKKHLIVFYTDGTSDDLGVIIPDVENYPNPIKRGTKGDKGDKGDAGTGIISGGTTNQSLVKNSDADYDTKWMTVTGGSSDHNTLSNLQGGTTNEYYHLTAAKNTIIGNTSGANTGDETTSTIKTKLGITTLSGSNTGDQTISDATITTTDITTNNVSTTKHGFFPKLPTSSGKFFRDDATWQTISGGGDMLKATYDPTSKSADAFAMDNMVEGTTNKILTSAERTKLTNTSGTNSGDVAFETTTSNIKMDGAVSVGVLTTTCRADHIHPTDTTRKADSMTTNKLLGRGTAATGVIEEITLGTNLALAGTTLNATDTNTITRLQGTGGTLASGDILVQGTGSVSTTQSGNTITIACTGDVTTAGTQTLTNKSLSDSTTNFVDVTDATKKLNIDVTGTTGITGVLQSTFTTAKTLILPDIADTIVTKTSTDTLTNKTLTTPKITSILTPTNTLTLPTTADTVVARATTDTLTNKRITKRVNTEASSGTSTPTGDSSDMWTITALAAADTVAAPTGTPTNGQELMIRILDNGTARALTWNAIYRGIGATLPATTVISKTMYCLFMYNSAATKWDCLEVDLEGDDSVTLSQVQTLTNKTLTSPKINEAVALTATATQLNTITAKAPIDSPTFTTIATAPTNTTYTTAQIRNVIESTGAATGGNNGDIWFQYTA